MKPKSCLPIKANDSTVCTARKPKGGALKGMGASGPLSGPLRCGTATSFLPHEMTHRPPCTGSSGISSRSTLTLFQDSPDTSWKLLLRCRELLRRWLACPVGRCHCLLQACRRPDPQPNLRAAATKAPGLGTQQLPGACSSSRGQSSVCFTNYPLGHTEGTVFYCSHDTGAQIMVLPRNPSKCK